MDTIHYIIISGVLIAALSIIGILLIRLHPSIARYVERNLTVLSAASGGVFLVTSIILMRETFETLALDHALLAFGIGILSYMLLHTFLAPHRHKGSLHSHSEKHAGIKVLIGDTLHNIADGLLLVASFGTSIAVGVSNAISIALHEAPQEISEFLVLKKSGFTNREAVYRNFATALSIFVGIAIGMFLIQSEIVQAYLLGITSTFFLGIVFTDLFPLRELRKSKHNAGMIAGFLVGACCMFGISQVFGHSHTHEDQHHAHGHEHTHHHEEHEHHHTEHIHDEDDHHEENHHEHDKGHHHHHE